MPRPRRARTRAALPLIVALGLSVSAGGFGLAGAGAPAMAASQRHRRALQRPRWRLRRQLPALERRGSRADLTRLDQLVSGGELPFTVMG